MRWWIPLAIPLIVLGAQTHKAPHRGHAERKVLPPPPAYDASEINNSNQQELEQGARGSGIVRAQILLDRAHFSCGQIDGDFGLNLKRTITAFQEARNIPPTGKLDAATWAALNSDQAPPLTNYTVSAEDERGPFVQIPADIMKQAKLSYLGYSSPVDELGERFHSSPEVLHGLNQAADFAKVGQQLTVPNVIVSPPPGTAARVMVSKSDSAVRVYDQTGKLMAFYMATLGSTHDPLPLGDWKVTTIERNPEFHYDSRLFWDAPNKNSRATIKPGPRNPVGVAKIGISKPHYGIHGTPDASKIGHTFSHGCIRLANWDAWELASMVKRGLPVILQE